MNFLAHMFLAFKDPDLICGNFLGDFIDNKEMKLLTPGWQKGVKLHRKIDYFTDNHRHVKACTRLLHETQHKYAPVVLDVLFDYILYENWDKYSVITFRDFEQQIYDILNSNIPQFPAKIVKTATLMVEQRFLCSYTSIEGLEYTFFRLRKRLKFRSNVHTAVDDMLKNKKAINQHFNAFFPEVIEMVAEFSKSNLQSGRR